MGKAATDSWRKALAWTGSRAADIPLYQAFLRAYPGDEAMQARLRDRGAPAHRAHRCHRRARPVAPAQHRGLQGTGGRRPRSRRGRIRSVLETRPNDGDALGGMGILRLRQEEFAQARSYLERATRQGSPARWKQALDSATYWTLIEQARAARESGDLGNARQLLDQAVRLDAREVTAENDLADVLAELGQLEAAEAAYRRVLARQADNPDAIRGLVGVLSQTGKSAQALKLVEQLTPSQQERWAPWAACALPRPWARPEPPPNAATTMPRAPALEDALLNDPGNPWCGWTWRVCT